MKTALYPGTFDPLTNGHMGLIRRGLEVFDQIIVAVADNTPKKPLFSQEERVEMAREALADESRVLVEPFPGSRWNTPPSAAPAPSCAACGRSATSSTSFSSRL